MNKKRNRAKELREEQQVKRAFRVLAILLGVIALVFIIGFYFLGNTW